MQCKRNPVRVGRIIESKVAPDYASNESKGTPNLRRELLNLDTENITKLLT